LQFNKKMILKFDQENKQKFSFNTKLSIHFVTSEYILFSVYEDVPKAFELWTNNGQKIYVYSSGSVEAQKLLFENSVHGDLLKVFCYKNTLYCKEMFCQIFW